MTMFDHKHYVPILKAKQGEFGALRELKVKDRLTPLIELPPISSHSATSLDLHITKMVAGLKKSWGYGKPFFYEGGLIPPAIRTEHGEHPMQFTCDLFRKEGLTVIPVTGTRRDAAYQNAVTQIASTNQGGVCIRLGDADFIDWNIEHTLQVLLDRLGVSRSEVDLIVDFGAILPNESAKSTVAAKGVILGLSTFLSECRTLTLAASSFPIDLQSVASKGRATIDRAEWIMWQNITSIQPFPRKPTFGDYAIAHPEIRDLDPKLIVMSANLRYTIDNAWLVIKGQNVRQFGFDQYFDMCKFLVGEPVYSGPDFSWGDDYIFKCSRSLEGPGNATIWRKVGTNHHIAMVLDQLSKLP